MKAISLWQPWGSLLFCPPPFRKVFETRPRSMGFKNGERVAIQAAQTDKGLRTCIEEIPPEHGHMIATALIALHGDIPWCDIPRGCILGTVEIVGTFATESLTPSDQERAFGDWRPGRVAIQTREPVLFKKPIPFTGQQCVFYVPDSRITEALAS